ncbi:hypothetical protein ACXEHT_004881 [Klebsiella variicola]
MKKMVISIMRLVLSGCMDLGRIGSYPELKTTYFNGHKNALENCLYSAALAQHLSMMTDAPLPGGTDRYILQNAEYEDVAWVDISPFGNNQTSVSFYYAPNAPDVHKAILSMISQCKLEMAD